MRTVSPRLDRNPRGTAGPTGDEPATTARARDGRWRARAVAAALLALCILWVAATNGFQQTTIAALVPVLTTAGIYAVAGVGLNLQFGHGGLLNFGYVAFMAVGGYATVLLIPHRAGQHATTQTGSWPLVAAVVAGMVVAAVLGAFFGIPTVRLRSDYLAIVMIALAEIVRILARDLPGLTGGVFGVLQYTGALQSVRPAAVDQLGRAIGVAGFQIWLLIVSWGCLVLVALGVGVLVRSPWGKLLRAVRDDEDAVRALGKSPTVLKLQALMIGGAIGGLGGALLAFSSAQLNPDVFIAQVTFFVFTIVILGGTGSTWGPAIGSVIFWIVVTQTGVLIAEHLGSGTAAAAQRYVLVGLLMGGIIIWRPQGLLGRREDVVLEIR